VVLNLEVKETEHPSLSNISDETMREAGRTMDDNQDHRISMHIGNHFKKRETLEKNDDHICH
jgi:hypothetical protein